MKHNFLLVITLIFCGFSSFSQNVDIQDPVFKSYLLGRTDSINIDNDPTEISIQEAQAFKGSIVLWNTNCSDLTGIESFKSISSLYLTNNKFTTLEINNLLNLQSINCYAEKSLTKLNFNNCPRLKTVYCYNSILSDLKFTTCDSINYLNCSGTNLVNLNLKGLKLLQRLNCNETQISSLNFEDNIYLSEIIVTNNQLTSIDVSPCIYLSTLNCSFNLLKNIDLSKNKYIQTLKCQNNNITSLDLFYCSMLSTLICENNNLLHLDLRNVQDRIALNTLNNPNLDFICGTSKTESNYWQIDLNTKFSTTYCNSIEIPDLNFKQYLLSNSQINNDFNPHEISKQEAVNFKGTINVNSLNISSLRGIENFVNLTGLNCSVNNLTNLEISKNLLLTDLNCLNNNIPTICISPVQNRNNWIVPTETKLDICSISFPDSVLKAYLLKDNNINTDWDKSEISKAEAEAYTGVIGLDGYQQKIKSISGIEYFKNLDQLAVYLIDLKHINLSNNTKLTGIYLNYCQLQELDVSKNVLLTNLDVFGNNLTHLDLTNNPNLTQLSVDSNFLMKDICILPTHDVSNWRNYMSGTFTLNCNNTNSDNASNAIQMTHGVITQEVSSFQRGRSIETYCETGYPDSNVIDVYYSFVAENDTMELVLTLPDFKWSTTMQLLDTLLLEPFPYTCISYGESKAIRNHIYGGLNIGQKYLARLEIGSNSPLGYARLNSLSNSFSIELKSTITASEDKIINKSNKIITHIYNLQGQIVNPNFTGLVIYKYEDGTTEKVIQE